MKHIMKFEKWNIFTRAKKSLEEVTEENILGGNRTIQLKLGVSKLRSIVFQTKKLIISVRSINNESIIKSFDKKSGQNIETVKIDKKLFDSYWNFCIAEGFVPQDIISKRNS